jgi:hypothetical protein
MDFIHLREKGTIYENIRNQPHRIYGEQYEN